MSTPKLVAIVGNGISCLDLTSLFFFNLEVFLIPVFIVFLKIFIYLFGCTGSQLQQVGSLVVACELLVAACMWDLFPWPGIEPGPPALGARSLIHCTTREVPWPVLFQALATGREAHPPLHIAQAKSEFHKLGEKGEMDKEPVVSA